MLDVINKLIEYFQFPFVRYAFYVTILIALCSSLLGVTLVLKRYSYIGDGLSHVAFGAMAFGIVINVTNNIYIVLPITIIVAILLLKAGERTKLKGDSLIALLSVGALAVGYLILNLFSKSANLTGDVCTSLFGSTSILTLDLDKVILCIILSIITIIVYVLFYNKIFTVTFDENFSRAIGIKVDLYNILIAVITAIIIVLAMNLVGSLLVSALIIIPALTAMRLFSRYKAVIIASSIISTICAVFGILISIVLSTPVGSTIVVIDIFAFLIATVIRLIWK